MGYPNIGIMALRIYTSLFLLAVGSFLFGQGFSQLKYDYVWKVGYNSGAENYGDSACTTIDFNFNPPLFQKEYRNLNTHLTTASICDTVGNFLFYTNGRKIENWANEIMEGGDTMVYDSVTAFYFGDYNEGRIVQGALVLPAPSSDSRYYVIYKYAIFRPNNVVNKLQTNECLFSLVDMEENEGKGAVIEQNVSMVYDSLHFGRLTACRHANGRDWWLLLPKFQTNEFIRFLLTPAGIYLCVIRTSSGVSTIKWAKI